MVQASNKSNLLKWKCLILQRKQKIKLFHNMVKCPHYLASSSPQLQRRDTQWSFCVVHSTPTKLASWAGWHHKAPLLKQDTKFWRWGSLQTSPFASCRLSLAGWAALSPRPRLILVHHPASSLATEPGLFPVWEGQRAHQFRIFFLCFFVFPCLTPTYRDTALSNRWPGHHSKTRPQALTYHCLQSNSLVWTQNEGNWNIST